MYPVCITRGLHGKTHNAYATEKVFQRETSLITSARNTFVFNNIQCDELHSQLITIHHILIFSATIWHNRARSNTSNMCIPAYVKHKNACLKFHNNILFIE